jgi:putative hydrolase of the HAD superfamily
MSQNLLNAIRQRSVPLEPLRTSATLRLCPIDSIETVLFDIYGTLLISGSGDVGTATATDSVEALTQALIVAGFEGDVERAGELGPALLREEIKRRHQLARNEGVDSAEVEISSVWKQVLDRLHKLDLLEANDRPEQILRLAVEYECLVNPVWPMPGAAETVRLLKQRGLRLGIVSNAQFYTPLILEALFGATVEELGFDPTLCVWSYKALRAKPDITLFKTLESKIPLSTALYVGNDLLNDVWTATQAGCRTILFAGDKRSLRLRETDKRCKGLHPTAIVDDLRQIPEMI